MPVRRTMRARNPATSPVVPRAITITSAFPGNSNAFNALMEELPGAGVSGSLCVQDEGADDFIIVEVIRNGPAPDDQVSFLPAGNYQFGMFITLTNGDVFDGKTLKLSQIGGPIALAGGSPASWSHDIFDFTAGQFVESSGGFFTSGTFQLTP